MRHVWTLGVGTLLVGFAYQGSQRGGPPGVFIKDVASHSLDVIQFDPAPGSVALSVMSPVDRVIMISTKAQADRTSIELKSNQPEVVRFSGIRSRAAYEIKFPGGSVTGTLQTPAKKNQPFTFAITADSHLDENSSTVVYDRTLANIVADGPAFLIDLGDTFMTGKHKDFREAISQYRGQRYHFGLVGNSSPIFLALGNHDGEQGWVERRQTDMAPWSAQQRKLHFPPGTTGGWMTGDVEKSHYYEFTWGDAQIIVLDPFYPTKEKPARSGDNWKFTLGEAQYHWLTTTLKASRPKYRFVFIHHLVGGDGKDNRGGAEASKFYEWGGNNSDGTPGFEEQRKGWGLPLHDLLLKSGVDAVFHGHDHFYAKQERDGLIYQLVPQPSFARNGGTASAEEYGYESGKLLGSSGYLRVSVGAESAIVEYVRTGSADSPTRVADRWEVKP